MSQLPTSIRIVHKLCCKFKKSQTWWSLPVGLLLFTVMSVEINSTKSFAETSNHTTAHELQFYGTDSTTTAPFTIEGGWEVLWTTESKNFQLSAYGVTEAGYRGIMSEQEQILRSFETFQPIVLADSTEATGKAFHRVGGTFYLKVVTSGPWTIHLKSVKRTKDYLDVPYTGAP